MIWEALVLLLAVWLLVLIIALWYLPRLGDEDWGRWGRLLGARISADHRARSLMREMLTLAQYQQLTRQGYVEVTSPTIANRVYRIPGAGGLVRVYEQGSAVMDLCVQPVEPLPDGDVVVMHKLMIEGNEQEYLAKANHFAPGLVNLRGGYL
ncbi:MAG TPA: hypothetical protein VKQ30_19195 [Ktedonobacterales bacterium]|nr:hypothetical protein [Ktedonobacterales bacterium]